MENESNVWTTITYLQHFIWTLNQVGGWNLARARANVKVFNLLRDLCRKVSPLGVSCTEKNICHAPQLYYKGMSRELCIPSEMWGVLVMKWRHHWHCTIVLQDILETVFDNGELVKEYTFAEVRENAELTIVKDAKKATKVKRCSLSLHLFTLSSLFVTLTRAHARSHVHIRTHTTKFLCLAVFEVSSLLLFRNKKISSPKLQFATCDGHFSHKTIEIVLGNPWRWKARGSFLWKIPYYSYYETGAKRKSTKL